MRWYLAWMKNSWSTAIYTPMILCSLITRQERKLMLLKVNCTARQCSLLRRKFMECSINNPALSLLRKHLVIGQCQKPPNFSAFHWSPHGSLVSIGQNFITTRVVHLPKRTTTSLITESDQSGLNHQLFQLCTARTAWSDLDQAVRTVHSCFSWFHIKWFNGQGSSFREARELGEKFECIKYIDLEKWAETSPLKQKNFTLIHVSSLIPEGGLDDHRRRDYMNFWEWLVLP